MEHINTLHAGNNFWRTHPLLLALFFLTIFLLLPCSLRAAQIHPMNVTNTSPVILVQGLPNARDPEITESGNVRVNLLYEITSNFTFQDSDSENLLFDGETTRALLSMKTGLITDMDLEIQIPYISHAGGFLDSTIINWHDLFGLPQNSRDLAPRNQLEYSYQKNGVTLLDLQEPAGGVGDVQLILGFKMDQHWLPKQNNLTLKTAIKFPSGDSTSLTGNGAYALSAWFSGDMQTDWFDRQGLTYMNLGVMWLERGEVLTEQQRSWVWFGGIGSGIKISKRVVLQAQLDTHSQFYQDSSFVEIDSYALQLTLGGNIQFNKQWNLDVGVVEDLVVHASPDVIFHLGLNGRF
ncbi:DUF3187 family protein [Kaarinaea lacus]